MIQTEILPQLWARQVAEQTRRQVAGKEETVLWMLAAILARGHILLEDIPGVGKTSLALALADALGLSFGRIQFTQDVMPSDVVGYSLPTQGKFVYKPGAVMCNLLLADELNRANTRTQAALLEAMEEGQVTVDGVSHKLPQPFVVFATQNPLGGAGTQPLPDSQLDRFTLRTSLGYPDGREEMEMLLRCGEITTAQVSDGEALRNMQLQVEKTFISEAVAAHIVRLIRATRKDPGILRGASPRATLSVAAMAKAWAQLQGRDYVIPEDARQAFLRCVPHRILARGNSSARLHFLLRWVPAPKLR